jgi:hypothetical protein
MSDWPKSRHFEMISTLPLKADIEVDFANVGYGPKKRRLLWLKDKEAANRGGLMLAFGFVCPVPRALAQREQTESAIAAGFAQTRILISTGAHTLCRNAHPGDSCQKNHPN